MQKSSRYVQRSFHSLCLKRNWFTFREYASLRCLPVSRCMVTYSRHLEWYSSLDSHLIAGVYRCVYVRPRNSTQLLTHQALITLITAHLKHPPGSGRRGRNPMGQFHAPPSRRDPKGQSPHSVFPA